MSCDNCGSDRAGSGGLCAGCSVEAQREEAERHLGRPVSASELASPLGERRAFLCSCGAFTYRHGTALDVVECDECGLDARPVTTPLPTTVEPGSGFCTQPIVDPTPPRTRKVRSDKGTKRGPRQAKAHETPDEKLAAAQVAMAAPAITHDPVLALQFEVQRLTEMLHQVEHRVIVLESIRCRVAEVMGEE